MKQLVWGVALVTAIGCGGGKRTGTATPLGDTHATPPANEDDPEAQPAPAVGVAAAPDAGTAGAVMPPPPEARAPRLVFVNQSKADDLVLAYDKGWSTVVFAYTGKPPKAQAALLFPTDCTASCEAATEDMCPVCRESEDPKQRKQEEKDETKREVIAAGASFELEWDGRVVAYEKAPAEARAKKKKCQCWRQAAPAQDTYTIKACGLRPAKKAGSASKMQCVETEVALPFGPNATDITLSFP